MTKHRARKQAIRSRMTTAGEPYSVAARRAGTQHVTDLAIVSIEEQASVVRAGNQFDGFRREVAAVAEQVRASAVVGDRFDRLSVVDGFRREIVAIADRVRVSAVIADQVGQFNQLYRQFAPMVDQVNRLRS